MNSIAIVLMLMGFVGFAMVMGKVASYLYLKYGQYKLNKVKKSLNAKMVKCDVCSNKGFEWEMTKRKTIVSVFGEPVAEEMDRYKAAKELQANPPTNTYCQSCSHTHFPFSNKFFGGSNVGKLTVIGGSSWKSKKDE